MLRCARAARASRPSARIGPKAAIELSDSIITRARPAAGWNAASLHNKQPSCTSDGKSYQRRREQNCRDIEESVGTPSKILEARFVVIYQRTSRLFSCEVVNEDTDPARIKATIKESQHEPRRIFW